MGMSLKAAIERFAWNDNFALAVARIREASPGSLTSAEITDAGNAWVAFTGSVPQAARDIINTFTSHHSGVTVALRANLGFTETELQEAIEVVHFALLEASEVQDASTSFDFATRRVTTLVVLGDAVPDSMLATLKNRATNSLTSAPGVGSLNSMEISLLRSDRQEIGGPDSSTEHLGGESLSQCTSGFGTISLPPSADRGISTAGHCSDSISDDGSSLTFQSEHQGTHGDFQWHTGSQNEEDDFYAGDVSTTETDRRDVSSVGSPVKRQVLCRNGAATHKRCQLVRDLNVCKGIWCNLVRMEERKATRGDSGGPVYWTYTAYGLHHGSSKGRDIFSRADRIDDALGIEIATSDA